MCLPLTSKVSKWVKESDDNLTVLNSSKSLNTKLNEDEDGCCDCFSLPLKQFLPISNELILGNSFKWKEELNWKEWSPIWICWRSGLLEAMNDWDWEREFIPLVKEFNFGILERERLETWLRELEPIAIFRMFWKRLKFTSVKLSSLQVLSFTSKPEITLGMVCKRWDDFTVAFQSTTKALSIENLFINNRRFVLCYHHWLTRLFLPMNCD